MLSYESALNRLEEMLADPGIGRSIGPQLKIMAFMGKDITVEKGLLDDIKKFLGNNGEVVFLIINPRSKYVGIRADLLKRDIKYMNLKIKHTLEVIKNEFKEKYPKSVKLFKYNSLPLFRLMFVKDTLFLGFYCDVNSYDNLFYQIPKGSALYEIMDKLFTLTLNVSNEVA